MRRSPELMQLLIGMSTSRYFPASGTAGFERSLVSGNRRDPAPPPMMTARVFSLSDAGAIGSAPHHALRQGAVSAVFTREIPFAPQFRVPPLSGEAGEVAAPGATGLREAGQVAAPGATGLREAGQV